MVPGRFGAPVAFLLGAIVVCGTDSSAQVAADALRQSKPTIRVVTLGHQDHGKSMLTAAITKVGYQKGAARFVPYDDLESAGELDVQGVRVAGAQVEYSTDRARYVHVDCRGESDYSTLLTSSGVRFEGAVLVVSATDGPMPQTREHLMLARKNGIRSLVVFLNKVDVATDGELVDLVELEIRELLTTQGFDGRETPVIRGSALMGLVGLRHEIGKNAIAALLDAMDDAFAPVKP